MRNSVEMSALTMRGVLSIGALLCAQATFAALPADAEVSNPEAELQVVREIETGRALADYWDAAPVEYRATAEAVLNSVGASYLSRDSIGASALTDFLAWFGGGGGAPQDLIKLRPLESATVQQETVVK